MGGTMALRQRPRASKGPRAPAADCCERRNHASCMIFQILGLKCTKFDFGWGSNPDPAGGAYSAPPDPLAGFKGVYL